MWAGLHDATRPECGGRRSRIRADRAAFSLVELLISLSLILLLTLALLTSYVFILQGDQSLSNYTSMNSQARQLLEVFGNDLRSATDVTNFTSSSLTITVPTTPAGTSTQDVIWEYDAGAGTFFRQDPATTKIYARNISTFSYYYTNGNNVQTSSLVEVKQVQISLRMLQLVASAVTSEYVISAQFTMRAKSTSH
jgi:type II secretory pathway pseudopilin PulG